MFLFQQTLPFFPIRINTNDYSGTVPALITIFSTNLIIFSFKKDHSLQITDNITVTVSVEIMVALIQVLHFIVRQMIVSHFIKQFSKFKYKAVVLKKVSTLENIGEMEVLYPATTLSGFLVSS